jgi:hypothetical protein
MSHNAVSTKTGGQKGKEKTLNHSFLSSVVYMKREYNKGYIELVYTSKTFNFSLVFRNEGVESI